MVNKIAADSGSAPPLERGLGDIGVIGMILSLLRSYLRGVVLDVELWWFMFSSTIDSQDTIRGTKENGKPHWHDARCSHVAPVRLMRPETIKLLTMKPCGRTPI